MMKSPRWKRQAREADTRSLWILRQAADAAAGGQTVIRYLKLKPEGTRPVVETIGPNTQA